MANDQGGNKVNNIKILFLSGGTGTPKLLQGTTNIIDPRNITIVGNTGDDWNFYGLHVSPDIDSILLTLTNLIDTEKWWGIKEDTFNLIKFLRTHLKEDIWFNLGDLDAGLCLYRSNLLKQGLSLTKATDIIRKRLTIESCILPMADQPVQTKVRTPERTMHLQEFWVKYKGKPNVMNVFFEGDLGKTTNSVLDIIKTAEIIIIGPSNPISSIGPILAISPIREALRNTSAHRIAISPIIGTNSVSGPTFTFLRSWGKIVSPLTIVEMFNDVLDGFMIHKTDSELSSEIQKMGVNPIVDDIYIHTSSDATRLIMKMLDSK
ncbi:MAG: 2-phospho-L-lactate transferase [Candidatus Hodarchaeota archaeon]